LDTTLHDLYRDLEGLRSLCATLRERAATAYSETATQTTALEQLIRAEEQRDFVIKDIETVPGARALEISPDGVFVCTQLQAYYKIRDAEYTHYGLAESKDLFVPVAPTEYMGPYGRYLPCTTAYIIGRGPFINPVGVAPTTPNPINADEEVDNQLYPFPEFSFQFEQPGIGFWANKPISAACLYGVEEPSHTSALAYIDRRTRVTVTAKPEARVPLTGTVRIVLHGYQILGNLDLEKLLGQ
jgi:hypothetical protein